jgi:hypothetical protein
MREDVVRTETRTGLQGHEAGGLYRVVSLLRRAPADRQPRRRR